VGRLDGFLDGFLLGFLEGLYVKYGRDGGFGATLIGGVGLFLIGAGACIRRCRVSLLLLFWDRDGSSCSDL
jgi:hypothetical protein